MMAGALNCVNWRRLGELPQECGALIMGFLDGKDLWAFVSSSKRWRKISDEVPSLGSSYAHGRMAHESVLFEQLSVWEKKYEKRFGKNAAVPHHLRDTTSWIERYLKYPLCPPCQANTAHDQVSLADRAASFCSFSAGGCATRRTGRPSTSHRAAYSTGALTGTVSHPTLAPALPLNSSLGRRCPTRWTPVTVCPISSVKLQGNTMVTGSIDKAPPYNFLFLFLCCLSRLRSVPKSL
jgi:hypothetical protein